ncbi:Sensor histidine kinase BtsS [Polaromonas vacuolata]|uniref:Sensor histidine kinase BtsS n=2 Tax=Polaromonas vacuolata TaxID=37448 RepID=A0A6H2H6T5_9BURK|nr:histidine kinase [Polaromonas vacuolata]QJC55477.1 Sensor histidine kinase BtsS [Polaromonas vacuolata]
MTHPSLTPCHIGVALRAVLFTSTIAGVAAGFESAGPQDWIQHFSLLSVGMLPATLAWLIAACGVEKYLQNRSPRLRWLSGLSLGAAAGLYGCAMLALVNLLTSPPWLASMAAGLLLSAVLLSWLFWRAKARMPAATTARLSELQSCIRPHFLFNTLNTAIALVSEQPLKAEAVLEDLSELFRSALANPAESDTLAQEVALARRYLAIEEIRFGARLRVTWQIDPRADQARVPPLLLQPLVENAIRHGVEPSADGAELKITSLRRGSVVLIKVSNTMPAGSGERGNGLALANLRERLALLHDVQAHFQSVYRDGIFQVCLEIPA